MMIHEYLEAMPSRVAGLVQLLLTTGRKGLLPDEAELLLQPPTLRNADAPASRLAPRTIEAAIDIGLLAPPDSNGGRLVLAESCAQFLKDEADCSTPFVKLMGQLLLAPNIGNEENEFAHLVAWLLSQPSNWMPQDHFSVQEEMTRQGIDLQKYRMTSTSPMDNVIYWARYLGLLWKASDKGVTAIIPDPTDYVRLHIDGLLECGERISIREFRTRLGKICPVLDGGSVRGQILAVVSGTLQHPWPDDRLSDACTIALRQMAMSGELAYGCPNDAREFLRMSGDERVSYAERPKRRSSQHSAKEARV